LPNTKTEQYTFIEITAFKGRSLEAKKNLYSGYRKAHEQRAC